MKVSEVVKRVRAAIDELMANDSGFLRASEDEMNLRNVIVDKIGYALQWAIDNAPLETLDENLISFPTAAELQGFSINGEKVGRFRLPSDLRRIVSARLSSWSYSPEPETEQSETFMMQQNKYTRGTYDRPVSILAYEAGVRYLLMYSAKASSDKLLFSFVRMPETTFSADTKDDVNVPVPSRLLPAFIYHVAGLAMVAFREDIATSLLQLSAQYLSDRDREISNK